MTESSELHENADEALVGGESLHKRRIGVFICHCGGNISDFVDVARLKEAVKDEADVVHAETTLFACSDGTQQDMVRLIREQELDGMVVASCSPKLHLVTFRGVSARGGLNPFQYTQVNIREQDSWAHSGDIEGATAKAIGLVRAGIAKSRLSIPLKPMVVKTRPRSLVIGGGVAGLRAAIALADMGLGVFLVERTDRLGGWVGQFGAMYADGRTGRQLVDRLVDEAKKRPSIVVLTNAELTAKTGSFGNYTVEVRVAGDAPDTLQLEVGSIIVATGFESYAPEEGEYGFGLDGVVTLPTFKRMLDECEGRLSHNGRPVRTVAYIYCVGSRQSSGNEYCSRYCCAACAHTSVEVSRLDKQIKQYHFYRDIRTYGRFELIYQESRKEGSVYLRFPDDAPPSVRKADGGQLLVTATDLLTESTEIAIAVDLVVLVTGMVARSNQELTDILKLPVGSDGFYNEIHPKLRPVETVVDGVMIAGSSQGPKSSTESIASGLAAAAQSGAMLMKGTAELDPLVATVDSKLCAWCGKCQERCPYSAISSIYCDGREVATVDPATCKGCGGCVPYCVEGAIDLLGSTDAQIRAMIDSLAAATPARTSELVR